MHVHLLVVARDERSGWPTLVQPAKRVRSAPLAVIQHCLAPIREQTLLSSSGLPGAGKCGGEFVDLESSDNK